MGVDRKLQGCDKIVLVVEKGGVVVDILDVRDIRIDAGLSTLSVYGHRSFTKACIKMLDQSLQRIDASQYSRITAVMFNRYDDRTSGIEEHKQALVILPR